MKYSEAKTVWENKTATPAEDGSIPYTQQELNALDILTDANERVKELKSLLLSTDYKDLPSYQVKDGEVLSSVIEQRNQWRQELRSLLLELGED